MKPCLVTLLRPFVYKSTTWGPLCQFTVTNNCEFNHIQSMNSCTLGNLARSLHSSPIHHKQIPTKPQNKGPVKHDIPLTELQVLLLDERENELGQMSKKDALNKADYEKMKLVQIKGLQTELPVFK